MIIAFARTVDEFHERHSGEFPAFVITPDSDRFNNFQYRLYGFLEVFTALETSEIFPIGLMFEGEADTYVALAELFKRNGPVLVAADVGKTFCSLLKSEDAYRELVRFVGYEDAVRGLEAMFDAAVLHQIGGPNEPAVGLLQTPEFHLGMLRDHEMYRAYRNAARVLAQTDHPGVDDAAQSFTIVSARPGTGAAISVLIDFESDALARNRIAVLVGPNGVGKTTMLRDLITSLHAPEINAEPPTAPQFNKLLAFSAARSDEYPSGRGFGAGLNYQHFFLSEVAQNGLGDLVANVIDIVRDPTRPFPPKNESDDIIGDNDIFGPDGRRTRRDLLEDLLEELGLPTPLLPIRGDDDTHPDAPKPQLIGGGAFYGLGVFRGERNTLAAAQALEWSARPVWLDKEGRRRLLSSGELAMVGFVLRAVSAIEPGTLFLLDEPESNLHPQFVSFFMRTLHALLEATQSAAVIATHSVYVVREVPRQRVTVLSIEDGEVVADRPRLQTFGASLDLISQFIFRDGALDHLFEQLVERWLKNNPEMTVDKMLSQHADDMNPEMLSFAARQLGN